MKLRILVIFASVLLLSACQNTIKAETTTPESTVVKAVESTPEDASKASETPETDAPSEANSSDLYYENSDYGFKLKLPETWKNFIVIEDEWRATALTPEGTEGDEISGVKLLIRHPEWTEDVKRQDIPIMIIPVDQWQLMLEDKFHIGAAPIGPSELGRNDQYVFALPARYNFAYLPGFEEVETILEGKPLEVLKSK